MKTIWAGAVQRKFELTFHNGLNSLLEWCSHTYPGFWLHYYFTLPLVRVWRGFSGRSGWAGAKEWGLICVLKTPIEIKQLRQHLKLPGSSKWGALACRCSQVQNEACQTQKRPLLQLASITRYQLKQWSQDTNVAEAGHNHIPQISGCASSDDRARYCRFLFQFSQFVLLQSDQGDMRKDWAWLR